MRILLDFIITIVFQLAIIVNRLYWGEDSVVLSGLMLFSISTTYALDPSKCTDTRCEFCLPKEDPCRRCKRFYMNASNTDFKLCLDKCYGDQYEKNVFRKVECVPCHEACKNGESRFSVKATLFNHLDLVQNLSHGIDLRVMTMRRNIKLLNTYVKNHGYIQQTDFGYDKFSDKTLIKNDTQCCKNNEIESLHKYPKIVIDDTSTGADLVYSKWFTNELYDTLIIMWNFSNPKQDTPKIKKILFGTILAIDFVLQYIVQNHMTYLKKKIWQIGQVIKLVIFIPKMVIFITIVALISHQVSGDPSMKASIYGKDKRCIAPISDSIKECQSCKLFYMRIPNSLSKMCLDNCVENQYKEYNNRSRNTVIECKDCNSACLEGCNGPKSHISEDGCKKCKYGIEINGKKNCLPYKDVVRPTCQGGYFLTEDLSTDEKEWTENICRKCHPECITCIGNGTHPVKDRCTCRYYHVTDYQGENPETCASECRTKEDYVKPPDFQNTCIRCKHNSDRIDPITKICIPKDTDYLVWILCVVYLLSVVVFGIFVLFLRYQTNQRMEQHRLSWVRHRELVDKPLNRNPTAMTSLGSNRSYDIIEPQKEPDAKEVHQPPISYQVHKKALKPSDLSSLVKSERSNVPLIVPKPASSNAYTSYSDDQLYISEDKLKYKEDSNHLIGLGFYGPIYKGKLENGRDGIVVAIKVIDDDRTLNTMEINELLMKTQLIKHSHIHRILGVCKVADKPLRIISPYRLGNLQDYLKKESNKIIESRLFKYCAQIASAMEFLEKCGIVHKNLCARSIMVAYPNNIEVSNLPFTNKDDPTSNNFKSDKWRWFALETLLEKSVFTHKTDVWSCGILCWEIFSYCETLPYSFLKNINELKEFLQSNKRLERPNMCTENAFSQIVACWNSNPDSRPSFSDLYSYFNNPKFGMKRLNFDHTAVKIEHLLESPTTPNKAPPLPEKTYNAKKSPEYINFSKVV